MRASRSAVLSAGFVLIAAMLWGTIGVVAKGLYVTQEVSPLVLSWFRLGFAAPLLAVFSFFWDGKAVWRFERRDVGWWLGAMLSMAGYQLFIFAAVQRTSVTAAQFLAICTAPILVALAAPVILNERVSPRVFVAGALALLGVTAVMGLGNPGDLVRKEYLLGNALALAAASAWAAYAIIARRLVSRYQVTQITLVTFAGAAILLLPWAALQLRDLSLSVGGWLMAGYLGVVATALAYTLYVLGLKQVTATVSVFLALAEPVTAAVLAAVIFGERLSLAGWAGVGLLVIAIIGLARG